MLISIDSEHDQVEAIQGVLEKIVTNLEEQGFVKERLGALKISHSGSQTFFGICKLPESEVHRRLDIKIYPRSQLAFALLYFTGSAHFNRSMRLFASKKGYSLSYEGLYPVVRGISKNKTNQKVAIGYGIPCHTEQDIF